MLVLHVIDSLARNGGAEQGLLSTVRSTRGLGAQHVVQPLRSPLDLQRELEAHGARVLTPLRARTDVTGMRHAILATRPDLVHTTLYDADLLGRAVAALLRVPCVSSVVNDSYNSGHYAQPGVRRHKVLSAQVADAVSARSVLQLHALTEVTAAALSKKLLLPRRRFRVIPRGRPRPLRQHHPAQSGTQARRRPRLLVVGRHEHQKGLDTVLRALSLWPEAQLAVAGREGGATRTLHQLAAELGVDSRVDWLGVRRDVPELMAQADALVLPSRWEGLGSVLIEGLAVGVPLIASDLPVVREVTDQGKAATLYRVDDAHALAGAMRRVVEAPSLIADKQAYGRGLFDRRYCEDVTGPAMLEFWLESLRRVRRAA